MNEQEIWKPIPGYEGYEVSDKGQVRSYFTKKQFTWRIADTPQRVLKPSKSQQGYLGINLRKGGVSYYRRIHQLVLLAFVGLCPDGLVACHNNDIPTDNQLENLRYDTLSENLCDVARNGNRILSTEEVRDIRHRRALLENHAQIARDYNVSIGLIKGAATGAIYKHVDAETAPVNDYRRKLTPDQVSIIKWLLLNETILRQEIAWRFGVSPSMITRIANGTRWVHVTIV